MVDSEQPTAKLELRLPGSMREALATAASSRGQDIEALAVEWLQDRLVHEKEKQEGLARKVRRS
jgi:predicted HicB family RNase H-like nuclease